MNDRLPQELVEFVRANTAMSLGTVGSEGIPTVADVFYAVGPDMSLYFVSSPRSRHAANIQRDGRVAATIRAPETLWTRIQGVQVEGQCTPLVGTESAAAYARYVATFPYVLTHPTLLQALGKVVLYRLTPTWVRWIDNTRDFGDYREFVL